MNYCKINTARQAQMMPNPFRVTVSNPTDEQKAQLAEMFGWLPMVYTEEPQHDPETQYVTDYWEAENGKAVQKWTVHDRPEPEPTIEDRVDNLEQNVRDIIEGVTE